MSVRKFATIFSLKGAQQGSLTLRRIIARQGPYATASGWRFLQQRLVFRLERIFLRVQLRGRRVVENYYTGLALRAGWRIDAEEWLYRPCRLTAPLAPLGFQPDDLSFVGDENDVADDVPPGAYLFTMTGRNALKLDQAYLAI